MWNETEYDDDFAPEEDPFQAQQEAQRRREETEARQREEWDRFVLEINNVIPGPLNDPRLFEEDSLW